MRHEHSWRYVEYYVGENLFIQRVCGACGQVEEMPVTRWRIMHQGKLPQEGQEDAAP